MTSQTTLAQVLRYFKKEYAKEDVKEVAKYKFDQMRYDPTAETFNDFLNKFKKVAKQAFGDKSSDITVTFLFAKLPVQMQNELAMAGKHDASMEEIRTFVQRRCQYTQLIPNTTAQPFNQISAPQPNVAAPQSSNSQPTQNRETKRKFDEQCRHCGITGHKWAECRKRLREEAHNKTTTHNQQQPTQPTNTQDVKPKYNPKLVCQICGKWDTPPETAITEKRRRQPTEASRILSSRQRRTSNSAEILGRPTTGSTTRTNCPTPPTTKPTMLRKWRDTMT